MQSPQHDRCFAKPVSFGCGSVQTHGHTRYGIENTVGTHCGGIQKMMNQLITEADKTLAQIKNQVDQLRSSMEFVAAIDVLETARPELDLNDDSARLIARLYCELQRPDLAIETLSGKAFASNPRVLADLAVYREIQGQFEEAEELINECIDRDPDHVEPELVLARILEHQGEYERAYRILANIIKQNRLPKPIVAIRTLYQLAQCLDNLGSYADAFAAASQAKTIQRKIPQAQQLSQQGLQQLRWAKQIHEAMDRGRVNRWRESKFEHPNEQLIHLIGHPRSGTTLLGQRLEQFSDVGVASEQDVFLRIALPQLIGNPDGALMNMDSLSPTKIAAIRHDYLRLLKPFCGEHGLPKVMIDKRPAHLTFLFGLLRLNPNAKFLVALRDPRDVLVSCFMRYFPLSDMSASLLSLGTTSLFYHSFMTNWLSAKTYLDPGSYMEVRYERLCNEPAATLSEIGTFIGSTREQSPQARNRYIHSPTFAAVRKPVRKTQIGRWRNYENQLKPFLKALDPMLEKLGYE